MSDLSKKILEAIKEKKIEPKPRWRFLARDYAAWLFFFVSILLGSVAFAVMLSVFNDTGLPIFRLTRFNLLSDIVGSLPYFWFAFLVVFGLFSLYNYQHTKEGYRQRLSFVMLASIALSLLLGAGLYYGGVGQRVDEVMVRRMPYYNQMVRRQEEIWFRPEKGFLIGRVATTSGDFLVIIDPRQEEWRVESEKEIDWPFLQGGMMIRMAGIKSDDHVFEVETFLPVGPGPGMRGGQCQEQETCPFHPQLFERK